MSDSLNDNSPASSADEDRQDSIAPAGSKASATKVKGPTRGRKLKQLGIGFTVLGLITIGGVWLMFGSNGQTRIRMQVGNGRAKPANTIGDRSWDSEADHVIEDIRRLAQGAKTATGASSVNPPAAVQNQADVSTNPSVKATPGAGMVKPTATNSSPLAGDLEAAVGAKAGEASAVARQEPAMKPHTGFSSQPNAEKSIIFDSNTTTASNRGAAGNSPTVPIRRVSNSVIARAPALPSFGSILPVRALGAIYTLRSAGLVRLEVTRRIEGPAWELDKGTVLVGTLRGSESDRAFISLVGFIDPVTERFVKLGGNVLGTDGGDGLRGKRRKLGGGWSKALGQASSGALGLAQSFANRGTTIILPNLTGAYPAPLLDSSRPKEFVEVAAGAQGYVMVTDLPREIKGVDLLENLAPSEIARASDSTLPSPETGLSEDALAELLTTGSPEQIRAALPRMTPPMRRIAETVLAEGDQ